MAPVELNLFNDFEAKYIEACELWLKNQFDQLTDELLVVEPSDWSESKRYLPPQVTPMPGFYSYDVAPYLREIIDNLSPFSPIREVDVMKGVQIGFTVGVIENYIGYLIDYIKNAPVMFLTADNELAQLRMETYVRPMIIHSGLEHLIKSADTKNTRKTGQTNKKTEWYGGGFIVPFGAKSANKLRSISIQCLLEDEIDGYPDTVGKDGDPCKLAEDRTAAYESSKKILRGSTPLIAQTSKILREYTKGDQRKYLVPCKHCNEKQELVFKGIDEKDGTIFGIDFSCDEDGYLIEDSVVYICKYCQGRMTNDDKAWMYREGGKYCEWEPTARPQNPLRRSYYIPALYSPVGMETWTNLVRKWLECWDVDADRVKDVDKLQWFYNNVLGKPFEVRGQALKLERVVMHRRTVYHSGEIPNQLALKETGSKILFITCAVDVHKDHLDIQVIGWCKFGRFYSIEWFKAEGDCEDLTSAPWQKVSEIIYKVYRADDGRLYKPIITLIDSQYNNDTVLEFCNDYANGVYPIRGTEFATKKAPINEFSEFISKTGTKGFNITTTFYKDRLSAAFRREWNGVDLQPNWYPNFPQEYPEVFFKELTIENKKEITDKTTGQSKGFRWVGRNAHAWDTTVYCTAGHDIVAFYTCQEKFGLNSIDRPAFWELCENEELFFNTP